MQVQVQSIHFDADIKLIRFIEEKVNKLTTFHDRIIKGEVFLRLDKSDVMENKIAHMMPGIAIGRTTRHSAPRREQPSR